MGTATATGTATAARTATAAPTDMETAGQGAIPPRHPNRGTSAALFSDPFLSWGRAARFGSLLLYGLVRDGDSERAKLLTELIRPGEILCRARLLALGDELLRAGRRWLLRGPVQVETQYPVPGDQGRGLRPRVHV